MSAERRPSLLHHALELWEYRDLLWAFIIRDVRVRYKQTALGVVWVLLQPLAMGGLFVVVFAAGGVLPRGNPADTLLFVLCGLVPWTSFAAAVLSATSSLEASAGLIGKVYFPRMIVPLATIVGSALDFCVAFIPLLVLAAVASPISPWLLLATPALVMVQLLTAGAGGLALSVLNAEYHDVKYAVPFLLQVGMFLTVILPLGSWPEAVRIVLSAFPMVAVIEAYRSLLLGAAPPWRLLMAAALVAPALFLMAMAFFRVREYTLADRV